MSQNPSEREVLRILSLVSQPKPKQETRFRVWRWDWERFRQMEVECPAGWPVDPNSYVSGDP